MDIGVTSFASGVRTVSARGSDTDALIAAAGRAAAECNAAFAMAFVSDETLETGAFAAAWAARLPGCKLVGCTTAGEMGPTGIGDGTALVILFPSDTFAVSSLIIEGIAQTPMTDIAEAVQGLRRRHLASVCNGSGATVAICLIDGMSYVEEVVTSAIFHGLEDIPLVGGSAGDRLAFSKTHVIAAGTSRTDRAVVVLMTTPLKFEVFKSDNFLPVDTKFVVTSSDIDRRLVMELNAEPAATAYAAAIGKDIDDMSSAGFASNPLVVRVGGEHFCRAIRGVTGDGGLSFACAIDDGVVLMLAEARGMVESTRTTFQRIEERLDGIDFVLGFDCAYRRIDAQNRQVIRKMSDLYRQYNVVGFGTYGEQYQSMHLNQTLTGIAFGRRTDGAAKAAAE